VGSGLPNRCSTPRTYLPPPHSGYDFGYLLKLLTASPLPPVESEFFDALHIWFPHVYDIKHIMRSVRSLKGGLQEIADMMNVGCENW
jgi:CCR4-NOT transcription complex subunit 7/8